MNHIASNPNTDGGQTHNARVVDWDAYRLTTEFLDQEAEAYIQEVDLACAATRRCLGELRWRDRQAASERGEAFEAATWEPQPGQLETLEHPKAARLARLMHMAQNAQSYQHKLTEVGLFEDQIGPMSMLLETLGYEPPKNSDEFRDLVADRVGGMFEKLPPGTGKTALMAHAALAVGVGTQPGNNPEARPLRGLVLVPSRRILNQTIGTGLIDSEAEAEAEAQIINDETADIPGENNAEDVVDGFAKFAPQLKVSRYDRECKDLSGDVVVMTYIQFCVAFNRGLINKDMFDILFADEAHHLMGRKTREARVAFCQGEIPVVGMTATSAYDEERHLSQVLRRQICDVDFRAQIDAGLRPAIQLLRVETPSTIKVRRRPGNYTEDELMPLALNEDRNQQVLDWVEYFVGQGRHVFVPCIEGDQSWHAQHLAARLSDMNIKVYDPASEEAGSDGYRPLRAVAIGSFAKDEVDQVLKDWSAGKIDAIFTVKMLSEGWNSKLLDVVVDASPTCSPLVMEQRLGRLTRFSKVWPTKIYVAFIDKVLGYKPQYTPWHVLRESMINPDEIIGIPGGPPPAKRSPRGSYNMTKPAVPWRAPLRAGELPPHLANTLGPSYVLIDEVTISKGAEKYAEPPADHVALADHYKLWRDYNVESISRVLRKNGFPVIVAKGRAGPMWHVHKDALIFLKNYEPPPLAPPTAEAGYKLAARLGIDTKRLDTLARKLQITPKQYRTFTTLSPRDYYEKPEARRIENFLHQLRTIRPGDKAVIDIATELGLTVSSITYYGATANPPIRTEPKIAGRGPIKLMVSADDAARIRQHYHSSSITPNNGRMTENMITEATGRYKETVRAAIGRLGLRSRFKDGYFRQAEGERLIASGFLERHDARTVVYELGGNDESIARVLGRLAADPFRPAAQQPSKSVPSSPKPPLPKPPTKPSRHKRSPKLSPSKRLPVAPKEPKGSDGTVFEPTDPQDFEIIRRQLRLTPAAYKHLAAICETDPDTSRLRLKPGIQTPTKVATGNIKANAADVVTHADLLKLINRERRAQRQQHIADAELEQYFASRGLGPGEWMVLGQKANEFPADACYPTSVALAALLYFS